MFLVANTRKYMFKKLVNIQRTVNKGRVGWFCSPKDLFISLIYAFSKIKFYLHYYYIFVFFQGQASVVSIMSVRDWMFQGINFELHFSHLFNNFVSFKNIKRVYIYIYIYSVVGITEISCELIYVQLSYNSQG